MEKRQHKVILSKHTNAPFYYNRWYYCKECKRMQSYEEDKVWNNNERALQYLQYVELRQQTFQDYKNIMRDSTK